MAISPSLKGSDSLADVRLSIDFVCGFIYNHICIYKSRDDVVGLFLKESA